MRIPVRPAPWAMGAHSIVKRQHFGAMILDLVKYLDASAMKGARLLECKMISAESKTLKPKAKKTKTSRRPPRTVEVTQTYLDALRKAVGGQIDPETAEVDWTYAQTHDPYGDDPNLPEEYQQVGREYFARSPETNIWISFGDLPRDAADRLWKKHRAKLAFPAGLEAVFAIQKRR
jgi:hypothetical protein